MTWNRPRFLTAASLVALGVGGMALTSPTLLAGKGVLGNAAAGVWMRELGVSFLAFADTASSGARSGAHEQRRARVHMRGCGRPRRRQAARHRTWPSPWSPVTASSDGAV